jgi:hypothetical protein
VIRFSILGAGKQIFTGPDACSWHQAKRLTVGHQKKTITLKAHHLGFNGLSTGFRDNHGRSNRQAQPNGFHDQSGHANQPTTGAQQRTMACEINAVGQKFL